jgi:hypothetical protein
LAVALAFPVAMALATGIEAPSSAIAQLGQLDDGGRRRFGRITLWLTLAVVGTLTLGLTAQAVHLGVGIPPADSTQIAEVARAATSTPVFTAFQLATALLLLSAASSSFLLAGFDLAHAVPVVGESGAAALRAEPTGPGALSPPVSVPGPSPWLAIPSASSRQEEEQDADQRPLARPGRQAGDVAERAAAELITQAGLANGRGAVR